MSIKSVHFSLSVPKVDKKKNYSWASVRGVQLYWQVISVPAGTEAQDREGQSWRQGGSSSNAPPVPWLTPPAVNRHLALLRGAASKHLLGQAWPPHAAWAWLSLPTEEIAGKGGTRRFVGARGARPIGRQHSWALELSKAWKMQAHGIRAAFSKRFRGLGGFACLLTHIKIGILVFWCHFLGSIFSAWEHYKHEISSCWACWI